MALDNPGGHFIDMTAFEIFVPPGETLTLSGYSSANATLACSLIWSEDI